MIGDTEDVKLTKHPLDERYESLNADLQLLPRSAPDYGIIETYCKNTVHAGSYRRMTINEVWKVDTDKAEQAFKPFEKMNNHKLLWHGTNVAVVAAILSGGLRIMPHSGAISFLIRETAAVE